MGAAATTVSATVVIYAEQHDGSGNPTDLTAAAHIFGVEGRRGGIAEAVFIIDEDGDLFCDAGGGDLSTGAGFTTATTYDDYEDAELCRALDFVNGAQIKSKWDEFVQYKEDTLIKTGIFGAKRTGTKKGEGRGLVNITRLQQLHNGAIWQLYTKHMDLQERYQKLEEKFLALEAK